MIEAERWQPEAPGEETGPYREMGEVLGLEYRKNSEDGHTELCNESYSTVTCVVRILLELLRP